MKKVKETPVQQSKQCLPLHGLYGVLSLFVVVSVAYSTYMVTLGVDGYIPKLMLVPQALFAAILLVYKFSKS